MHGFTGVPTLWPSSNGLHPKTDPPRVGRPQNHHQTISTGDLRPLCTTQPRRGSEAAPARCADAKEGLGHRIRLGTRSADLPEA